MKMNDKYIYHSSNIVITLLSYLVIINILYIQKGKNKLLLS